MTDISYRIVRNQLLITAVKMTIMSNDSFYSDDFK